MRTPVEATTRSPLKWYAPGVAPVGTLMLYVNAEKSPGATAVFAWVAYAVVESHPLDQDACADATLQVTLSEAQTARLTWLVVPTTQVVVPMFAKNTENDPVSPGFMF